MVEGATITVVDQVSIPVSALTLEGFRAWARSDAFPEQGRIDFLAGSVEAEMSPEDLLTHGIPKTAITAALFFLVDGDDRGEVYVDRARLSSAPADLSAEPDVVVVLWESLEAGRVRYVPATSGKAGRYVEMEGSPDLVVELISDGSVKKDTVKLPGLYAKAGIPEMWLVDARDEKLSFQVHCLKSGLYVRQAEDANGWRLSPLLGRRVRLTRRLSPARTWRYRLEHAAAGTG